ncbi:ABC transporter ATP-binding protein [Algisphaera agarilytica]|uniref:ABC-2 type transport system ATP-binding protein n=1 Tax=Algisphaera agarilytica TaxID=1385975 RepID=A0A7X0LJH2_9BACT|nr:ABC transporter ATP-binding protein [Algisphaera agarilytica]MBB6428837.1 ABC-2 type transport system ATP-binding protein [Algisphaera agarilytica]
MQFHVENLTRTFGKTKAVNDLSFSFETGQIFAFVGPNGAGKTTTMRILATLDVPDEGGCRFDDLDILQYPEEARRMIGYMPDNLPTHRDLTVHDYLDFFARAYGLRGRKRIRMVEQIEEFTNLMGIREKMLKALSKGMKQRVSLARALIHDPPLLIMDEPAAGLDPRARVELRELLKALSNQGKAVFISSHILTELAEIADGAVIIERGGLLRAGTIDQISRHGRADNEHFQHVAIRTKDRNEELYKTMLEMPYVKQAKQAGPYVEAEVAGDEDQACELLAELLRREYRIIEFKQVETDLEQLFMDVTKGDVQ